MITALLLVASLLQSPAPALPTAPEPTEVEQAKIEVIKKQAEINDLQTKYAAALQELGALRLAMLMQQGTPKCGDTGTFTWNWQTLTCVPIKK